MNIPRTCIICHAEKLGEPVTEKDCLGFVACETCTKAAWSEWLKALHERDAQMKQHASIKRGIMETSAGVGRPAESGTNPQGARNCSAPADQKSRASEGLPE